MLDTEEASMRHQDVSLISAIFTHFLSSRCIKEAKDVNTIINQISSETRREEMMCLHEQPSWSGGRSYPQQFSLLNRICHVDRRDVF